VPTRRCLFARQHIALTVAASGPSAMRVWAAPALAEPLTGVDVVAGLRDRCQQLVVDGEPTATGVVAVGDAWAFVNPRNRHGMSIGLVQARVMQQVLREPTSPTAPPPK
jgi:hypothetical protein